MPEQFEVSDPPSLLEWHGGVANFHGLAVQHHRVDIGGRVLEVAGLRDAADLLDLPDYARRFTEDDIAPYGLELWPSAIMLARHVRRDEPGGGRLAVELGCGLGLVSIVATECGWRVTATDNDPDSLRFAAFNAEVNSVRIAGYELLDWRQPPAGRRFARVFGADVLYQLVDHEPILRCIDGMLEAQGVALLADPNRGVADPFKALAEKTGFRVEIIKTQVDRDRDRIVSGRIFILRRPEGWTPT